MEEIKMETSLVVKKVAKVIVAALLAEVSRELLKK